MKGFPCDHMNESIDREEVGSRTSLLVFIECCNMRTIVVEYDNWKILSPSLKVEKENLYVSTMENKLRTF